MKVVMVMLPTGEVVLSVPDQPEVSFEEAVAKLRQLRADLSLAGVPVAGDDRIESHLPDKLHEHVHQVERQAQHE